MPQRLYPMDTAPASLANPFAERFGTLTSLALPSPVFPPVAFSPDTDTQSAPMRRL